MKLIDSHAHLDFEQFHDDFPEVLARAKEAGVAKIINIGADLSRSRASIELAENYNQIFATVGVHPEEANDVDFETIHDELLELAKSSEKVVGIGETGLDYYAASGDDLRGVPRSQLSTEQKEAQMELFKTHIEVAKHLGFPLVIHIRNGKDESAANDAYEILKESGYSRGVIHCFTLDTKWAKLFTELGFSLGFTGIITYKNTNDIQDAVKETDISKILIETDCPFLAPQKYRGKRNEPAYVVEVAQKIAELKGETLANIANSATINAENLFKI